MSGTPVGEPAPQAECPLTLAPNVDLCHAYPAGTVAKVHVRRGGGYSQWLRRNVKYNAEHTVAITSSTMG